MISDFFRAFGRGEIYDFLRYDYESGKTEIFEKAIAIMIGIL